MTIKKTAVIGYYEIGKYIYIKKQATQNKNWLGRGHQLRRPPSNTDTLYNHV